jgi:hypothetical protein
MVIPAFLISVIMVVSSRWPFWQGQRMYSSLVVLQLYCHVMLVS